MQKENKKKSFMTKLLIIYLPFCVFIFLFHKYCKNRRVGDRQKKKLFFWSMPPKDAGLTPLSKLLGSSSGNPLVRPGLGLGGSRPISSSSGGNSSGFADSSGNRSGARKRKPDEKADGGSKDSVSGGGGGGGGGGGSGGEQKTAENEKKRRTIVSMRQKGHEALESLLPSIPIERPKKMVLPVVTRRTPAPLPVVPIRNGLVAVPVPDVSILESHLVQLGCQKKWVASNKHRLYQRSTAPNVFDAQSTIEQLVALQAAVEESNGTVAIIPLSRTKTVVVNEDVDDDDNDDNDDKDDGDGSGESQEDDDIEAESCAVYLEYKLVQAPAEEGKVYRRWQLKTAYHLNFLQPWVAREYIRAVVSFWFGNPSLIDADSDGRYPHVDQTGPLSMEDQTALQPWVKLNAQRRAGTMKMDARLVRQVTEPSIMTHSVNVVESANETILDDRHLLDLYFIDEIGEESFAITRECCQLLYRTWFEESWPGGRSTMGPENFTFSEFINGIVGEVGSYVTKMTNGQAYVAPAGGAGTFYQYVTRYLLATYRKECVKQQRPVLPTTAPRGRTEYIAMHKQYVNEQKLVKGMITAMKGDKTNRKLLDFLADEKNPFDQRIKVKPAWRHLACHGPRHCLTHPILMGLPTC